MKHSLNINEDESLFTVITEGEGDVKGIIAFLKDIISHPKWKPGKFILLDHRALRIDKITVSGIDEVSMFFKSIANELGNGKIALVMKRDIDFGIARAWEIVTDSHVDISINVFRDIDKAIDWLEQ
jgi:hypothetical protein